MKTTFIAIILTIPFLQDMGCSPPPTTPKPVAKVEAEPDWQTFGPSLCGKPASDFSKWEHRRLSLAIDRVDLKWLDQCHKESRKSGFHPSVESQIIQDSLYGEDPEPILKQLFAAGVTAPTDQLWQAVFQNHPTAITLMVKSGTDPNALSSDNPYSAETVLNHAATNAEPEVLQALIDAGADPTIRTIDSEKDGGGRGWINAAEWAEDNPNPKSRVLLKRAVQRKTRELLRQ